MSKKLGLGLIPIALPIFLSIPLPVLACGYSDILCSLRNTFHEATNRYVGESAQQEQEYIERVSRPRTIEDAIEQYKQSSDPTVRTLAHLEYPQNERSITKRIGSPSYRGQDGDYYRTSRGDVLVWYVGDRATGFMVIK